MITKYLPTKKRERQPAIPKAMALLIKEAKHITHADVRHFTRRVAVVVVVVVNDVDVDAVAVVGNDVVFVDGEGEFSTVLCCLL